MPQSQEASNVRGDEEGRKGGRSSGTQLSSSSHLDRSDGQNIDAQSKGLVAIAKSSVACCGEAEPGDPLGGAMQYGGGGRGQASHDERRTMSAAGARKLGGRSDGGEGQSEGREWPFYRS
ncbi:hypothetical protein V490_03605 [Pseudogymnoascus sp. VKM F-3557]|nr:hypothetical protein V490_03605 [Pseudogymnoascus sp. VKM F-3557]